MSIYDKELLGKITDEMVKIYSGDPKRVQHFLKVHAFSRMIGEKENLPEILQMELEIAALVHDIALKKCEDLYGSTAGKFQEFEGPTLAGELLEELGVDEDIIDRVCFLVSKHHTYEDIEGDDWQILIEADFLANAYDEDYAQETIENFGEKYFKTDSGKEFLSKIYG